MREPEAGGIPWREQERERMMGGGGNGPGDVYVAVGGAVEVAVN